MIQRGRRRTRKLRDGVLRGRSGCDGGRQNGGRRRRGGRDRGGSDRGGGRSGRDRGGLDGDLLLLLLLGLLGSGGLGPELREGRGRSLLFFHGVEIWHRDFFSAPRREDFLFWEHNQKYELGF